MSESVELSIGGMTCASCAARIEKKLNKLDGVTATVNYATEKAHVSVADPSVDTGDLVSTVEKLGYSAALPRLVDEESPTSGSTPRPPCGASASSSRSALALPVLLMSMVPALQFDNWQWLALTLASPVVVWGAWPFHHAAWVEPAARHGDHGHADQRRRRGCLPLVGLRAVLRRRRDARHDDGGLPHRIR